MLRGIALLWFLTPGLAMPAAFTPGQDLVSLVSLRLLTGPRLSMAALFCGLSALGFLLGIRLQLTISQQRFATIVLIILLGVGLSLVRSSVMGWR